MKLDDIKNKDLIVIHDTTTDELISLHKEINSLSDDKSNIFTSIIFTNCDLFDEKLLPVLATLFKCTGSLRLVNCTISHAFISLLLAAKSLAGNDYSIKNITLVSVDVHKTLLKQLRDWLLNTAHIGTIFSKEQGICEITTISADPPISDPEIVISDPTITSEDCALLLQSLPSNYDKTITCVDVYKKGLVFNDPLITVLGIYNITMIPDMFHNEAFLQFLTPMPNLSTLILKNLIILDRYSFHSLIAQSLKKLSLTELTVDFWLDDADLIVIIELLKQHRGLTRLTIPQGQFSDDNLIALADVLSGPTQSVVELVLPQRDSVPKSLVDALKNMAVRKELIDSKFSVYTIIDQVQQFANTMSGRANVKDICACWNEVIKAHMICQNLIKEKIASSVDLETLGEQLAICFSYLLVQTALKTGHMLPGMVQIKLLGKMIPFFSNPKAYSIFYHNLYLFCSHHFSKVIDPEHLTGNNTTTSTSKDTATEIEKYEYHCECIREVLLYIPLDNNLYYRENVNQMLMYLFKSKMLNGDAKYIPSTSDKILAPSKISDRDTSELIRKLPKANSPVFTSTLAIATSTDSTTNKHFVHEEKRNNQPN